jgi:hypothetical protein
MEASGNCSRLQESNSASVSNYTPISILNNSSKLFEFFIHAHVSHYLKVKITPLSAWFRKIQTQHHQFGNLSCFHDPSSRLSHALCSRVFWRLCKLVSQLPNRQSQVRISGTTRISSPFQAFSGVP